MNKTARAFVITVAILLVIVLILQTLFSLFGDRYTGRRLKDSIQKSSNNRYALTYDDLDINLIGGSLQFEHLQIKTDTTFQGDSSKTVLTGSADYAAMNGISLWSYLIGKNLTLDVLKLNNLNLQITPGADKSKADQKKKPSFSSVDSTLYHIFKKKFHALGIDRLSIKNSSLLITRKGAPKDSSIWIDELNLILNDIEIDSASATSERLFIADDIALNMKIFNYYNPDSLYTFSIHNLAVSSEDQNIDAASFNVIPRLPKHAFSRKKGKETDRIKLHTKHIKIGGINFEQSINHEHFYAQTASINQPRLEIYHDKRMPPGPPSKKMLPSILFKQLSAKIKIDSLAVENGYISYSEQKAKLKKPGTISFENLTANLSNLSNYDEDLNDEHIVKLDAQTDVMGKAPLHATFQFPMGDNDGLHSVQGTMGQVKATDFNEAFEYMALARFKEGIVYRMDFSMKLNAFGAQGNLTLDYENFKVDMLKVNNQQLESRKTIKSFVANTFVIKDSNHKRPLKTAKIDFKRKEQKSIFNLWWKALRSGLKDQIGIFN